ncbi:MAG: hypothetical protein ACI8YQ_002908 [Polaribacter sp.]|jgi:hypothetical protein
MQNNIRKLLFLALLLTTSLQAQQKVLVIGIDGARPDALQLANTPNIDNLIADGIYSPHALNDDITISGPGWSAILCGVWSDKHLVTGNDFSNNNYTEYPMIFKYIEEENPDLHTVSFVHWDPINDNIVQDHADFKLNLGTDLEVATQAASYMTSNDPDIFFLHFDDVDHAGHGSGFTPNNPAYIEAIEEIDVNIGIVLDALIGRPNYAEEDWLILLTPDHGGLGFSHGGTSQEEQEVFFIASGASVAPSVVLRDSMLIADNPTNCLGDTVELQFNGNGNHVEVSPNPIFDFGADQDFTIECRVRTTLAADVAIVGNKDWDSGGNPGFIFSFRYASGPEWKVNIGDGSNRADINTGGSIADNNWHTLTVSFDRDGEMKMYEDGVFLTSADISNVGDINTNEGLFFGADIDGDYAYQGAIAEVRVWNTIVGDQEVSDWACTAVNNTHPNWDDLLGYWKMNEGAVATAVLDEINNNNGLINGAIWNDYDSIVVYDYTNTPRLPDVAVTALTHLCVPIDDNWNLDGNSWVAECMPTSLKPNLQNTKFNFNLSPNPVKELLTVSIENYFSEEIHLIIYDVNGKLITEVLMDEQEEVLDVSEFGNGLYWLSVEVDGEAVSKRWIKL